jgi:hypothetical protein
MYGYISTGETNKRDLSWYDENGAYLMYGYR